MEIHQIIKLVNQVSLYSILIPATVAITHFQSRDKAIRLFAGFIIISVVIEGLSLAAMQIYRNNLPLLWTFTFVEFLFFSLVYIQLIKLPYFKAVGYFGLVAFSIVLLGEAVFRSGITSFNSYSRTLEAMFLILYGLLYFFQILRSNEHIKLEKFSWFWINTGALTYFIGNIFMFMVYEFFVELDSSFSDLWIIHSVLNITANVLYAVGLLCHRNLKTA